jgi:RNA polymerase sigma-70 factor (ECF subfamily)
MTVDERVEEIYAAERNSIYSYLLYLGVPPQRAQELAQDSFVKLYLKMVRNEVIENPRAWLYRVAYHFALRFHQREPVFDELPSGKAGRHAPVDAAPDPERSMMDAQRNAALADAIGSLSPQQRHCLHLRVQGLRYREIAEAIGISTSAVGEFLRRAVARLQGVRDV